MDIILQSNSDPIIDMNPFEPPEIIDVPLHQPGKRFSAIPTILIVAVILLGMFGLGVWRSHVAVSQEEMARQRAIEQQEYQQQLKKIQESEVQ
jgi:hypothetical protein